MSAPVQIELLNLCGQDETPAPSLSRRKGVVGSNPPARSSHAAVGQMRFGVTDDASTVFVQFSGEEMLNPRYTIIVHHYLLGAHRIQITDRTKPDPAAPAGHGSVVQEMCTYQQPRLTEVVGLLRQSREPLELARSWIIPNSENGRLRPQLQTQAA